ncbi:MAG: hypothetical protein AB1423_16780, partial [Pseudomonadota bacterium]
MNYFNIHRKIRLLIPFISFLAIFLTSMSDSHASPAGYSQYFVPGEEEKIAIVFEDTANNRTLGRVGGITKAIYSAIGITSWSDNTRIYIDHWEDGYEFDPDDPVDTADEVCPVQNTGSFLNLISQDVPSVLAERTGLGGDCLNIATPCATPITANGCYYDGKDLIFVAGGSATLTRTVMPEQVCNDVNGDGNCVAGTDTNIQPNPATLGDGQAATVQALAWEVYPVRPQLTTYIMPFGEDLYALGMLDFDHVLALVQATEDNTSVQVDFDADGTYDAVDANLDGDCNDAGDGTIITLDMGETLLLSRNSDGNGGAGCGSATALNTKTFIQGTSTLQVNYISGNAGYLYDIRGYAAFPRGFWDNEYYAPVDSGAVGHDTDIYIHNPWGASITIDYQNSTGSGSLTVPANSTVSFYDETGAYVPDNSSVYLNSQGGEEFWAVSAIDTEDGAGTYNWSYPLVPAYLLDNEYFVGYAPGSVPVTVPADYDNSGLFIATVQDNTTVFVDYDADGPRAPVTYTLNRLQTQYIYDAVDGDLAGTSIISTGPFIAAWGENPETATVPTGLPALDAGYVGLPGRSDWIDLVLMVDKSTDPVIIGTGTGQTTKYTITVSTDEFDVEDVRVTDILAVGWAFCTTTTTPACPAPVITFPDLTTSNDTPSIDVFDVIDGRLDIDDNGVVDANDDGMFDGITVINGYLDTNESGAIDAGDDGVAGRDGINVIDGGLDINGSGTITGTDDATNFTGLNLTWDSARFTGGQKDMAPNQTMTIEYWAYTTATHTSGSVTVSPVEASADRTVGDPSVTQTFTATDSVFNLYTTSNMSISKTSDVATVAYPGDTIAYTVTINNTGPSTLTGVAIYDPMPDGVNYVAGSGSVTCELQQNYRDEFGAIAYNNTNGSVNWSANPWAETDPGPGAAGATSGFIWIWAGQLQFRYVLANVRDEFNTNGSYAGNDGSNNWTAAWTEVNDDGSASITGNPHMYVSGNRLWFDGNTDGTNTLRISRAANITGATSVTISFLPVDEGIDGGEALVAEYSLNGGSSYTPLGTFDGGTGGWSGITQTYSSIATGGATSIILRFRATGAGWSSTDEITIDNVNISFNAPVDATGSQIQRTANLTGATTPQLNFSYSSANLEAGDTLVVEASSSAAGPFTTLATFAGGTPSLAPPYDLTPYISATTTIQFRITSGYNVNDETFSIDNVDITYYVPSTFPSGSPPNFLSSSTDCSIQSGNSLTLTFNVTIDDPLDSGITEITNTAYVTTTQIPLPIDASVT